MLRGLKKADVKHSRISLLWSHSLVVHQCQQKALGIPQRRWFIGAFLYELKTNH
jgi:hypothetical protein